MEFPQWIVTITFIHHDYTVYIICILSIYIYNIYWIPIGPQYLLDTIYIYSYIIYIYINKYVYYMYIV